VRTSAGPSITRVCFICVSFIYHFWKRNERKRNEGNWALLALITWYCHIGALGLGKTPRGEAVVEPRSPLGFSRSRYSRSPCTPVEIQCLADWGRDPGDPGDPGDPAARRSSLRISCLGGFFTLVGEGDPKGWSTVLITALGSWEKTVPRGHLVKFVRFVRFVC
jgi:hypothetical protein